MCLKWLFNLGDKIDSLELEAEQVLEPDQFGRWTHRFGIRARVTTPDPEQRSLARPELIEAQLVELSSLMTNFETWENERRNVTLKISVIILDRKDNNKIEAKTSHSF